MTRHNHEDFFVFNLGEKVNTSVSISECVDGIDDPSKISNWISIIHASDPLMSSSSQMTTKLLIMRRHGCRVKPVEICWVIAPLVVFKFFAVMLFAWKNVVILSRRCRRLFMFLVTFLWGAEANRISVSLAAENTFIGDIECICALFLSIHATKEICSQQRGKRVFIWIKARKHTNTKNNMLDFAKHFATHEQLGYP
jgi:hypothetical protein